MAVCLSTEMYGQTVPCACCSSGLRSGWDSAESSAVSFSLFLLQRVTVWIRCLTSGNEAVVYWTSAVEHNRDNGSHCRFWYSLSCIVCLTLSRLSLHVYYVPIYSVSSRAASCPLRTHTLTLLTCRFVSTSYLQTHSPHLPLRIRFVNIDLMS